MSGLTKEVTATCGKTILVVGLSNKDEVMYVKSTIRVKPKNRKQKKEFKSQSYRMRKVANEKNTLGLRLIPLYLYPSLPIGIVLTSIGGEERVFDGSNISTDVRFGCMAWGIKPKKD